MRPQYIEQEYCGLVPRTLFVRGSDMLPMHEAGGTLTLELREATEGFPVSHLGLSD